jgi:predicted dehydrogenase
MTPGDGKPPLRLGLIGVGRHGSRYVRHIADMPEAKLVAVCRRTMRADQPAGAAVRWYTDFRELIADPTVEALIAVTPPSVNRDICLAAVEAKKPLLIEKPLAVTAADAALMVQAAREAGVTLMTAHTLRFDPTIVACRAAQHEVGARRYFTLTLRMEPNAVSHDPSGFNGRGILLEIGVHLLDLVRFLTGDEVEEVRCLTDVVPPAAESRVFAWLRAAGGSWALVDMSRVSSGRVGRVECIGSHGQFEADWQARRLRLISTSVPCREWQVEPLPTIVDTVRAFADSVHKKINPVISGEDGKRAVEIAEACYESARRNGEPVVVRYQ